MLRSYSSTISEPSEASTAGRLGREVGGAARQRVKSAGNWLQNNAAGRRACSCSSKLRSSLVRHYN